MKRKVEEEKTYEAFVAEEEKRKAVEGQIADLVYSLRRNYPRFLGAHIRLIADPTYSPSGFERRDRIRLSVVCQGPVEKRSRYFVSEIPFLFSR